MTEAMKAATAVECLANRIMAMQYARCVAHQHFLCSTCAGQWIDAALALAVAKERERVVELMLAYVPREVIAAALRAPSGEKEST